MEKDLAKGQASNQAVLQAFIRESNISLCAAPSSDKRLGGGRLFLSY